VDAATPAAAASTGAVTKVAAPATVPAAAAPVAKPASAPVYEHVLYPGETLDDVARQYGSSQQEIMKLNNITDPSSIKPGTKLLVPIPE
jgi:spore germination protein